MLPQVRTDFLPFVQSDPNITKLSSLNAPQAYTEVFDTYTPFRTCRYMDGNRIFRACSVHYFTEVPAYGVPWYDFIPHFLVIVLLMFIFARVFCGWVCPLGSIQDFLGIFRKWIGLEHWNIPQSVMNVLKVLRIIWITVLFLLAIAIAIPLLGLVAFKNELFLIACQTCPARNIFPLISGIAPTWFPFTDPLLAIFSLIGIFFLILLALGFFGKRLWCRFCPNGIIQGWFSKGSLFSKEKDVRKCTKCGVCKRVCPMDNEHVYEEKDNKNVNNSDCIMCFSCVDKCPENDCLKVKFAGKEIARSKYKAPVLTSKYVPPTPGSEPKPESKHIMLKLKSKFKHHKKSKK
jgi:polyferredoxin